MGVPLGTVWGVTSTALPLMPGSTLTLTDGGTYFKCINDLSVVKSAIEIGWQTLSWVRG